MSITVCTRCLRNQHDHCTAPDSCACEECNPPVVVWEEPTFFTKRKPKGGVLTAEQEQVLRDTPKRWARVRNYDGRTSASSAAIRLRQGKGGIDDPARWEFTSRGAPSGGSVLYVRFIGDTSASASPVREVLEERQSDG